MGNVVTTGDYNGDGIPDLITAVSTSTGDYEINIQISNGNGGFTQGPTIDLGPGFTPIAIAAADFTGDGKLDFAIVGASGYSSSVYVAIQHPGGFLITPITLPEEISTYSNIAVGDLNGDKLPDIVIPTNSGVTFLLNAGKGKFDAPEFASTTPSTYVVLADVNGDKNLDLVVLTSICCSGGSLNVILGDGHGGFYEPGSQPTLQAVKFAVADLNGDGKPDIVAVDDGSTLQFVLGNGNGTFGSPQNINLPATYTSAAAVAAADLNGDGQMDLAVIAEVDYQYQNLGFIVYLNGGKGVFNASTAYSVGGTAGGIILSKLTSSSAVDALLTPTTPTLDGLLINNGKGVFADGTTLSTPDTPEYLVSGDFNNDGRIDLAGVSSAGLTVYLNAGNTTILNPLTPLPFYTGPLVTGDFNGDGRLDIVDVNGSSADTLLGAGGGTFVLKPPSVNLGGDTYAIAAADMNGDGKLDLVINTGAVVFGNGDGTFGSPNPDPDLYCYSYSSIGSAAIVADFNRDGKPDLLSLCQGYIYVLLNDGSGTLGYPTTAFYTDALGVAVGDFNKDGIPDFAYTVSFYSPTSTATDVYIELGTGNGSFTAGPPIQIPGSAAQLVAADFNGDGNIDLAALDAADGAVIVLAGKGDGTFQNPLEFGTANSPNCLLAVTLHDPARTEFPDLVACSAPVISFDYNATK